MMTYELTRETTVAGVGFFEALPTRRIHPSEALAHLKAHPHDGFMRLFVVKMLGQMGEEEFYGLVERAVAEDPPEFQALLLEACLAHEKFAQFQGMFEESEGLAGLSPLALLRAHLAPDLAPHRPWMKLFRENMTAHRPMPLRIAQGFPLPVDEAAVQAALRPVDDLARVKAEVLAGRAVEAVARPTVEEVAEGALAALRRLEVFASPEQRHEKSLSAIALFRQWHMSVEVENGNLDYGLHGVQNSYGKGLTLPVARASLYMEIVERLASFASFGGSGLTDRTRPYPLRLARYSELRAAGLAAVDPNSLRLEAVYADTPLHWLEAAHLDGASVLFPAQLVFLFTNLDEIKLTKGLDSTGLASGSTLAEARLAGLCEALERDAEAVMPYVLDRCFRLVADDPQVAALLADYAAKGVDVVFQDLTTEFGLPIYKAFVLGPDGEVAKGTAAKMSGRAAALSALLEVTYPYPDSPPSAPAPADLPVRRLEELPEYATGDPEQDLALLDTTLRRAGHTPVYLDLTRADTAIPVARAFVPGLELAEDFDATSRVSPRLLANFRRHLAR